MLMKHCLLKNLQVFSLVSFYLLIGCPRDARFTFYEPVLLTESHVFKLHILKKTIMYLLLVDCNQDKKLKYIA